MYCIIDLETDGLPFIDEDAGVLEICIYFSDRRRYFNTFIASKTGHNRCFKYNKIRPKKNAISWVEYCKTIYPLLCKADYIVGHSVAFDLYFLVTEFRKQNKEIKHIPIYDTKKIMNMSLEQIAKKLNLHRIKHRSKEDVKAIRQIWEYINVETDFIRDIKSVVGYLDDFVYEERITGKNYRIISGEVING